MMDYSVVITHLNRENNLRNTLEGLSYQSILPKEVIVVEMGVTATLHEIPELNLKVVEYPYHWNYMPLAAARNFGAAQASGEHIVFLDVDCIPAVNFCEKMVEACHRFHALIMGSPKYLLKEITVKDGYSLLEKFSVYHPARPTVKELQQEDCYELFWSLCFSIPASIFKKMGGFDENYMGYGAEDTDFALTAKALGIPFFLSVAQVYHQQHALCIPPLNHLESIVRNCNYYKLKWGHWPMPDCLLDFTEMQFIDWEPDKEDLVTIHQLPTSKEISIHLVEDSPYR